MLLYFEFGLHRQIPPKPTHAFHFDVFPEDWLD